MRTILYIKVVITYATTAQPHQSVSENSFYKHIDCDLPESERMRQLLIWCSMRTSTTSQARSKSATSSTVESSSNSIPAEPELPSLSKEASQVLKSIQDCIVRTLAEKKMNISILSSGSNTPAEDLRENEQNTKNRHWQVTYTTQIDQFVVTLDGLLPFPLT